MALVHLSAPSPQASDLITQKPRFYGVKAGRRVLLYCVCQLPLRVDWFRAPDSNLEAEQLVDPENNVLVGRTNGTNAFLLLLRVTPKDSGVYYCRVNGTKGSGTSLQVLRPVNVAKIEYRSTVKDGLIFLQGIMLASCIAAPLLRRYTLVKKEEAIYEDPQQDHIYEGLVVETCEAELYEDISTYTQNGGAEATWEKP